MKVVILLGAGATVSDVSTRPLIHRPPLDRGFFAVARGAHPTLVRTVDAYVGSVYGLDLRVPENDSLETVMGQVYTDLFNPALETQARGAFADLLKLFTRRLAVTTNNIDATNKRWLYRILASYLGAAGAAPSDLTIVTFNQDLQVEKLLCLMSETARWRRFASEIFNFPWCYRIGEHQVTAPTSYGADQLFDKHSRRDSAIRVLKLHGSLNWYSTHNSPDPGPTAMFRSDRRLSITRRRVISPDMTLTRSTRSAYTLPVVVPPVSHKSAVLHRDVLPVWQEAERALSEADELVIFGYSCPQLDFESSNLLRRAQRGRDTSVSVIDPNGAIATRYIEILDPHRLHYYPSARTFLSDR